MSNHYLAVKAIDCLKALRAFCVKVDPDIYNIWTNKLKKALLEKKNFELLNVIREGKCGKIIHEILEYSGLALQLQPLFRICIT